MYIFLFIHLHYIFYKLGSQANSRSCAMDSIQNFARFKRITFQMPPSSRKRHTIERKPYQHYAHASFNWLDLFKAIDEGAKIRKWADS